MDRRHPHVANLDEVPPQEGPRSGAFAATLRPMGAATGGSKLGCTFTEVEPGQVAWPHHWHAANEEAILVVSGTGTLRIGDATVPIRAGDYVALPCGVAHQLQNTGTERLRYWCVSTRLSPEVVGYPDSGKLGAAAEGPDGRFRQLFAAGPGLGYFDGDPLAAPGATLPKP